MKDGQQQFMQFILNNVKADKQEQAKELLQESFSKQADGTFNKEYLETFISQMLDMIKDENQEQVQAVMMKFKSQLS